MIVRMRKASFYTAMIGFCLFALGFYGPALAVRFLTEALRVPYFWREKIRDQVNLGLFVMAGCIFGLIRLFLLEA